MNLDAKQPNILLILADDLGFSDLGSYGSEIDTPNLDALAASGVRFANHHTAASCAPTRAMLMTGVSSHLAGLGNMPESLPSSQQGHPAYQGVLRTDVPTIAEHLQADGYHTYMTGKWHLGKTKDTLPSARGFEQTLILADTGADNWEKKPYLPTYEEANWYANGEKTDLPENFYSSEHFIDKTIDFLEADRGDGKPFFSYIAFQAVHIPVQAPAEFTEKYTSTYQGGWHQLRQQRYQGAVSKKVVQPKIDLPEMNTTLSWEDLTLEQQAYEAKSMAVYAGMVDAMDYHLGRLFKYLEENDQLDNTIIIFMSDNGAEPSDMIGPGQPALSTTYFNWWLESQDYRTDIETLGERGSYNMIGPSFASAAVSPLSYYKFFTGEGGMRVPLIISGIDSPLKGQVINNFTYVTDLVPTLLKLSGVETNTANLRGKNLLPLIQGESDQVRSPEETVGFELGGNGALFKGDFKLVKNLSPVGDNEWHLFNITEDPAETTDLSSSEPELFKQMLFSYQTFESENGVLPIPLGYDQRRQVAVNQLKSQLAIPGLVAILFIVMGLAFLIWRKRSS